MVYNIVIFDWILLLYDIIFFQPHNLSMEGRLITWSMTIWLRSQCLYLLGQSIRTVYVVYFYLYVNQNIHICNKFCKLCEKKNFLINVYIAYMHCFLKFLSLWSCWYTDCISTLTRHDTNVALLYWLCIQTVNWSYFNRRFLSSENKKEWGLIP